MTSKEDAPETQDPDPGGKTNGDQQHELWKKLFGEEAAEELRVRISEREASNPKAPRIDELFSGDNPVARFVVSMCAARNDVHELSMLSVEFRNRDHWMFFHVTLASWAHALEGLDALNVWRSRYGEVKAFVSGLPDDVQKQRDNANALKQEIGAGEYHALRNALFHYAAPPTKRPCDGVDGDLCANANPDPARYGDEALIEVLNTDVGSLPATIYVSDPEFEVEGEKLPMLHFDFAEQVRLGLAIRGYRDDLERFHEVNKLMQALGSAFTTFVDGCLAKYLDEAKVDINDLVVKAKPGTWPNPLAAL